MKKQLTLEHLACYLPYGLKIYNIMDKSIVEMSVESEIYKYERKTELNGIASIMVVLNSNTLKPILRHLSDLHNSEWSTLVKVWDLKYDKQNGWGTDLTIEGGESTFWGLYGNFSLFKELFRNHFDLFGLIDDGLAIDINDLNK